jgi:hypothetical protein
MSERNPVKILAERHGGIAPELRERFKRQRKQEKAIRAALAEGPKTVAELAEATEMNREETLWLLMALKKYGEVVEGEQRDDCYAYELKT